MATVKKVVTTVTDDLNGKKRGVETVRFGVGNRVMEIDLTAANRRAFERSLDKYMKVARTVAISNDVTIPHSISRARNEQTPLVRKWARENGFLVADRGRIMQHIVDAYQQSHKASV